jgi:hypothetical protein
VDTRNLIEAGIPRINEASQAENRLKPRPRCGERV